MPGDSPGATNLLTAVAEAYVGALPLVILAGRAITATAHRGASQEVPTNLMFAPVTKSAIRADRADYLPDLVRQAFALARSGKPGPVLIDIPRDLFEGEIEMPPYVPSRERARIAGPETAVTKAASLLLAARRPLIVAGGGTVASGAFGELRELAELLRAPVLTSMSGRGSLPDDHVLAAGGLGAHRNDLSKRLLVRADVLIGLGTRFEEMETNWRPGYVPAADAKYIQVDLDAAELGRSIPAHVGVVGDVRTVLRQLLELVRPQRAGAKEPLVSDPRVREVIDGVAAIDAETDLALGDDSTPLSPLRVIRAARAVFPRDTTVAADVGCLGPHRRVVPVLPRVRAAVIHLPVQLLRDGFRRVSRPGGQMTTRPGTVLRRGRIVPDGAARTAGRRGQPPRRDLVHPRRPGAGLHPRPAGVPHERPVPGNGVRLPAGLRRNRASVGGCYGESVAEPGDIDKAFGCALDANATAGPQCCASGCARTGCESRDTSASSGGN